MKPKLNKEICKKCSENFWRWNESDERRWKNGRVACLEIWETVDLKGEIPEDCPYRLEHVVMGNNDET